MTKNLTLEGTLARSITRAASQQAYYTIRFLVDRDLVDDAYGAYAYFRWMDDIVDAGLVSGSERSAFLERQKTLLDDCYRDKLSIFPTLEEKMLIQLIRHDHERNSGMHVYLHNMMEVMEFDVNRRGRLISQAELDQYTHCLASAVTEAMHYFIGHGYYSPHNEYRYLAVTGAHIVHMLRDAYQDLHDGYYNIPSDVLETARIHPQDIQSGAYRAWVQSRIQLARKYFNAGREYLAQVENARCRLAGFAYMARFEWLLDTIELEDYILRRGYGERKSLGAKYQVGMLAFSSMINSRSKHPVRQHAFSHLWRKP